MTIVALLLEKEKQTYFAKVEPKVCTNLSFAMSSIITESEKAEFEREGIQIQAIPLYEWLLDQI